MSAKKKPKVICTSGKRKTATARATIKAGVGRVKINHTPLEILTPELARLKMSEPLRLAGKRVEKVDVRVNVNGGGIMGQADAARTAIARGLVEYFDDADLRETFLSYERGLVVNDPRQREPKHPLGRGARKKRQKSYR